MKKKILGIPLTFVVIGLLMVVGATAGLLAYYGTLTSTVDVQQSVVVDNKLSGVTIVDDGGVHTLKNRAGSIAPVEFETSVSPGDFVGITTSYVGVLELATKVVDFGNTPWVENGNAKATIHYNLTGDTFDYEIVSSTEDLSGYRLIYYKDNSDRFNDPASAILVNELTGDLPYESDGNVDEHNYCSGSEGTEGEDYVHCHGAKLWLVPEECVTSDNTNYVISWDVACTDKYLFETDLMAYSQNDVGKLNLPANGGGVNFQIVNYFNVALKPGSYTITTKVVPVVV